MIYRRVDLRDFHLAFINMNRGSNFSVYGLTELFRYLEEFSNETGQDLELDVVALCCEYAEDDLDVVLASHEMESLDELQDHTWAAWLPKGRVIYRAAF